MLWLLYGKLVKHFRESIQQGYMVTKQNNKSPDKGKVDNKNETAMKSNCAGIGNAATNQCVLCQCD